MTSGICWKNYSTHNRIKLCIKLDSIKSFRNLKFIIWNIFKIASKRFSFEAHPTQWINNNTSEQHFLSFYQFIFSISILPFTDSHVLPTKYLFAILSLQFSLNIRRIDLNETEIKREKNEIHIHSLINKSYSTSKQLLVDIEILWYILFWYCALALFLFVLFFSSDLYFSINMHRSILVRARLVYFVIITYTTTKWNKKKTRKI